MDVTRRAMVAALGAAAAVGPVAAQQPVTMRTADAVTISGRIYGRGARGVVLVPGAHGIGSTWHFQALRLARAGFHVLAIDYRGLGPLGGEQDDGKTDRDVRAAIALLKARGASRIALVGASWGARAAAMAAIAEPGLVDRLVLLAPSGFDSPELLPARTLFIVADGDREGSGKRRLDSIRRLAERAPRTARLIVLPGEAHAQFLFLTEQGERLTQEMLRFLAAR
jgi:pimeloyl-ACP methyl ester carboxylesterase